MVQRLTYYIIERSLYMMCSFHFKFEVIMLSEPVRTVVLAVEVSRIRVSAPVHQLLQRSGLDQVMIVRRQEPFGKESRPGINHR